MFFFDDVRFVRFFKKFFNILIFFFVFRLYLFVKLVFFCFFFMFVVLIFILFELCSLYIVEVDLLFWFLNNCFFSNLLISVDLFVFVFFEIYLYNFIFWNIVKNDYKLYIIFFL